MLNLKWASTSNSSEWQNDKEVTESHPYFIDDSRTFKFLNEIQSQDFVRFIYHLVKKSPGKEFSLSVKS